MRQTMVLFSVLTVGLFIQIHSRAQQHDSTSVAGISEQMLLKQLLDEPSLKGKEVQMLIVNFPPGIISGAHRHPCQTFGYLMEGELESEFEGKKYAYRKGDVFYELPNGLHSLTRNPSKTQTARLLVFFILDKGQATSVKEHR